MTDHGLPFLTELRAELRRAAYEHVDSVAHKHSPKRALRFAGVPALVVIAVVAYIVLAAGSTVAPSVPVVGFSPPALAATVLPSKGSKVIGNEACIKMSAVGAHLPPLVRSNATPDKALLGELSMLRGPSTALDRTSLGRWDRFPLLIGTVFQRYARVFNAPEHVRVAFLPVTYCNETEVSASSPSTPGGVFRQTLEQGLVMLLLSNRGEHPPVLVGTAQQIKHGPALAGLDVSNNEGFERAWLQTTVVPDGVARVAMEFTAPYRYPRTISLNTTGNVGIAVRHFPYTPTIVYWYAANGRLIKKFVDQQALALHDCEAAHKKGCFQKILPGSGHKAPSALYHLASNHKQSGAPALIAQADALYQPARVYESSITPAEIDRSNAAKARVSKELNACDAPYSRQLFRVTIGTENYKLYMLWNDASDMQQYEAEVAPLAPQLSKLASSWMALSLKNPAMNAFAHATAAELDASLNAAPMNTCAFVRAIAAHHFSYKWARTSSYGQQASDWWKRTTRYDNQAASFQRYITPPTLYANTSDIYRAGGPGWRLFTHAQTSTLANLPGEPG